MNLEDHYQALYDEARTAMDDDGHNDVPLLHVTPHTIQTSEPEAPPFTLYRQDVERPTGTMGGGPSKLLRSSWVFTAYTIGLGEGLSIISSISTALDDAGDDITTADGYSTVHFEIEGVQSLYEQESNLYATHLRIFWERSL